jgi:ribosomal protein L37AE/L43A
VFKMVLALKKRFFFGSKPNCPLCNSDENVMKNDGGQWCCTKCDWVDDEGTTGDHTSISFF